VSTRVADVAPPAGARWRRDAVLVGVSYGGARSPVKALANDDSIRWEDVLAWVL
jgi:carboxypeptidase C (cathepsin A)